MSSSVKVVDQSHQSDSNQNDSQTKENDDASQFIVKRTEPSDIYYFTDPITRGDTESSKLTLEFNQFFNLNDIEMAYENSTFSITVIDQADNNSIVGIFIFNNTPFAPVKIEDPDNQIPNNPGLWEDWFYKNFDEKKVNGQNSLWMVYLVFDNKYAVNENILQKIFLKIHLSLTTTLSFNASVMFLLSKTQNNEVESYQRENNINESQSENNNNSASAVFAIQTMLNYMYEQVKEIQNDSPNNFITYINRRNVVFPIIEIRMGTEFDHDDLENIFKEQTPPETANQFEDFFIAKMIANQDDDNKVLVGQVNDKAIGLLAISTDINVNFLVQNFKLEEYDNLLKQDYMAAVNLKRMQISTQKINTQSEEMIKINKEYRQEIMKCERISQRLFLQKYIQGRAKDIDIIDDIEKTAPSKEDLTKETATEIINKVLENYKILYPELERFEGKIKVEEGECLLSTEFDFFIETLEFFGLPKGYMHGAGHWDDWLEKEAKKREQKEQFRKKLGQASKTTRHKRDKKENEQPIKPSYFDFSPLGKAMRLFKDGNITVRTFLRKTVKENKNLIASFFVDENNEPSDLRCFDIMSLAKKLNQAGINVRPEFADKIGPILLCFGGIPYTKRIVQRMPEHEVIDIVIEKKDTKKKKKKAKEVKDEEEVKKEEKPIDVTVYEVSISDFFKAIDMTFQYDKLMYEIGEIDDPDFIEEYNQYMEEEKKKFEASLKHDKSEYEKLMEINMKTNENESEKSLEKYKKYLDNYTDENAIPPTPDEVINAFCVKLFFIEQAFESRSSDFLLKVFDQFPDKDYLVLTQPHSFIENSLLEQFIKIDKKVDSLFGEVLYIIHRESLMISLLKVDFANEDDLKKSTYLFEQLNDKSSQMYDLALYAVKNKEKSKFMCVVCKINEHIVGICLLSKEVNIEYYDSHFSIRDYMNLDKISKYFHSRIVFFESHKNFAQYTKVFFKEILRLVNKIALYYEIDPDAKDTPKFFNDFILTRNRKFPHFIQKKWEYEKHLYEDEKIKTRTDGEERDDLDEKESDFCLLYLSKKMMVESRIANNNRIVVIGASDTGISFIESLLSIRYLEFSYIYLVAPGGLLYHHIEDEVSNMKVSMNNYQIKDLKKLLLEKRIKIINSKVIDIKPKQKYIQFEDLSILNYDYCVFTMGLQDHLWKDLKAFCDKKLGEKFAEFRDTQDKLDNPNMKEVTANLNALASIQNNLKNEITQMIYSIDNPNIYEKFSITDKKMISLRKNPHYEILLYGRNLNLLCFIQGLIQRNIPPKKIKLVIPNIKSDLTTNKQNLKDERKLQQLREKKGNEFLNLDDDLEFINGNSLEECPDVESFILETLKKKGVQVYKNYNFAGVKLKREEFTDPANIKPELQDLVIESFKFLEDGKDNEVYLTTNLIVTGGMLDVDPMIFKFIHENGLVYNGRAIINNNFLTADSSIFAAGKLCEFSQCYQYIERHKQLRLECYNSQEVGYTLAKYFLQTIDSQLNVDASAFDDKKLPNFYLPLPTGCYLPDNYIFFKAKSVKETNPKIYQQENNRQPLIYNTLDKGGCYLSFGFNIFGIIDSVVYFGKEDLDYRALVSLVGLHETYLNKLLNRFEGDLIENIPIFLSENWALALYHDKFSQLVIKLKAILHEEDIYKIVYDVVEKDEALDREAITGLLQKVGKRTKAKIEYEIVSFLNENRNQLPFYHIPALKPVEDSTQDGNSANSSKKSSKKVSRQESAK